MLHTTNTFPADLGISSHVGLTRGVGGPHGFAEAQTRYREEQLAARRAVRAARAVRAKQNHETTTHRANRPAGWATFREGMTRWTTWPSSAPRRRSSAACPSSAGSRS